MVQKCPLCKVCGPSCCNWALIAIGPFMHGINPQAGWLWGPTLTTACELLCRSWPHKVESSQQGLGPAEMSLWICCLQILLDPVLMLSEAGHWVCWLWASWEVLWCRPMSDTSCGWPWATCFDLQVTHSLWLPLLGLGAQGKDQAFHQDWLLLALGLGTG